MPRLIRAEGPLDARIALIGETPWKSEEALGRPFAGASGNLLHRIWQEVGLTRHEIHIDNVYPYKPPEPAPVGDRLKSVKTDDIVHWIDDLHRRIAALRDPYVIVPTGNYALYALLRKGKVPARLYKAYGYDTSASEADKKAGILNVRGSIYVYRDLNGRLIKVIPTLHPAAVLQSMNWEWRTIRDWKRIKEQARTREFIPPERRCLIDPSVDDWAQFYTHLAAHPDLPLCTDVETWGNTLTCSGFSYDPSFSITFPMPNKRDRAFWLPYVKVLCELPNPKIGQNVLYDAYWYAWYGARLRNISYDTMCMHHCLDPNESHSLEFLTSIYTYQPYYKDEAKEAEEIVKYVKDMDALYRYNGLDCCVPVEIYRVLRARLEQEGMWDFYLRHYREMYRPLLDTMLHGVRVDVPKQKELAKAILKECDGIRVKLKELAGEELYATERKSRLRRPKTGEWTTLLNDKWPPELDPALESEPPKPKYINREAAKRLDYIMSKGQIREYKEVIKKDFSGEKLKAFFKSLGVPIPMTRGRQKKETLGEAELKKLARKYPAKVGEIPLLIIKHRKQKKEHGYFRGAWDSDHRIRCHYKQVTKQGRLSSAKNPMRKGYNLQNVKRGSMRETFLADEGCLMVRIDYSQIEDRLCKMYTGHPEMIELANTKPWEYDAHTENARVIFGKEKVTKEQRYLGKRAVHAAQRGMAGDKLSDVLLKDDYNVPPGECQKMIDAYLEKNWQIRDLYFPMVRERVVRDGYLVNAWGRKSTIIRSPGVRFDDDLWREAYSYLMQSDCADTLNVWGFKPAHQWMIHYLQKPPNLQVHDEVVSSLPFEMIWDYVAYMRAWMEQPLKVNGAWLVVPVGITIGPTWGEKGAVEFKRMPEERGEFEERVREGVEMS